MPSLHNKAGSLSVKTIIGLIAFGIIALILISSITSIVSWNETGRMVIVQYPNGHRMVRTEPGPYFQWWGKEQFYKKYVTVGFGSVDGEDKSADIEAVDVIFNDGSGAQISGIVRVELPTEKTAVENIWVGYAGGFDHFVQKGIVPVVENAIRLAANLRNAQDAYTTIAIFQADISDQLKNGIFKTTSETVIDTNADGGTERRRVTKILLDEKGIPLRERHVLQELGCKISQCQIKVPVFDKTVITAIQKRKEEALNTEIAKQTAIRAEQQAKTIAAVGKAQADSVKWEFEKKKSQIVTQAEAARDSAKLMMEASKFGKEAMILDGQGIAEKKKLIMTADGALEMKLATYERVQNLWAKAFAEGYKVPTTMIGGGDGKDGNVGSWQTFMNLMSAKTAKDLNFDPNPTK